MSEYYEERHDIAVSFLKVEGIDGTATVESYRYPEGDVKNTLSPDELRDVAEMLDQAADDLEELNNDTEGQ
jgi:hypothetical protein